MDPSFQIKVVPHGICSKSASGSYVLCVHMDNNGVTAILPQPSIGGVSASDDCGFLRYSGPADLAHIEFVASRPNNHAVFGFGATRGLHCLASASTQAT